MKQLTVISGKGGTGKTSVVAAFAALAQNTVFADCDVDAADLHLLIHPHSTESIDFTSLNTARIDDRECIRCGRCVENCRFNAVTDFKVNPMSCEGCGVCEFVCPVNAVSMHEKTAGQVFTSKTRYGPLCHALLYPGESASGKLVTVVRNNAKKIAEEGGYELILVDGSPGIGCPVIASIGGVDLVLIVTEPTMSGLHDLARVLEVADHFNVKASVCINKYDINPVKSAEIEQYCLLKGVGVAGKIPYDTAFTQAMVDGKSVVEYGAGELTDTLKQMWSALQATLNEVAGKPP